MSKTLVCKECGNETKASDNAKAITCSYCVDKMIVAPTFGPVKKELAEGEEPRKRGRPRLHPVKENTMPEGSEKWPRCWWLKKEFVAPNGKKYQKGKPI